jgi:hypothetical protein
LHVIRLSVYKCAIVNIGKILLKNGSYDNRLAFFQRMLSHARDDLQRVEKVMEDNEIKLELDIVAGLPKHIIGSKY